MRVLSMKRMSPPAGAAALAGVKKMVQKGAVKKSERVLVLISGSGLKDPNSSLPVQDFPFPLIEPSLSELEKTLRRK